jgi:1-acyl-sn-glycerol-3-phosphate acyltransferase
MLRWLAKCVFRLGGWKALGEIPDLDKAVFIAAPHTSNWDGFWLLVYKLVVDVDVRFLAKHTLFWWPLGPVLTAMGALPIDRSDANNVVPQLVSAFEREEHLFLALAPEGTRSWAPYWKTGFHRIASAAGVPVVLAHVNYARREVGIGPVLPIGRSLEEDFVDIRAYYVRASGKRPELQGPISYTPE